MDLFTLLILYQFVLCIQCMYMYVLVHSIYTLEQWEWLDMQWYVCMYVYVDVRKHVTCH